MRGFIGAGLNGIGLLGLLIITSGCAGFAATIGFKLAERLLP